MAFNYYNQRFAGDLGASHGEHGGSSTQGTACANMSNGFADTGVAGRSIGAGAWSAPGCDSQRAVGWSGEGGGRSDGGGGYSGGGGHSGLSGGDGYSAESGHGGGGSHR